MDPEHRNYLEEKHDVRAWFGRGEHGRDTIEHFELTGSEVHGWELVRAQREHGRPNRIHSMWRRGENDEPLLSIDVIPCASVRAAHEQVIEVLGTVQSDAIERTEGGPGDVTFRLNDTLVLFARANIVVLVRNAGRELVDVIPVARELDKRILDRLDEPEYER
jgi:hypothetical protein